jgi:hypothetical protein
LLLSPVVPRHVEACPAGLRGRGLAPGARYIFRWLPPPCRDRTVGVRIYWSQCRNPIIAAQAHPSAE